MAVEWKRNITYRDSNLYIFLPKELNFNSDFIDLLNTLFGHLHLYGVGNIDKLIFVSKELSYYSRMSKVYLDCMMRHWHSSGVNIYADSIFLREFKDIVQQKAGKEYQSGKSIDLYSPLDRPEYYCFESEKESIQAVNDIVSLLDKCILSLDRRTMKDFLVTTIGEVFSNAFYHSSQDKIYFMYDISCENGEFYLIVAVVDFGRTIIANVKDFFRGAYESESESRCLQWAMKDGNTTRHGSGGYGFSNLQDYINQARGNLWITSGRAQYILEHGCGSVTESPIGLFMGTSVAFKIKLFDKENVLSVAQDGHIYTIKLSELK